MEYTELIDIIESLSIMPKTKPNLSPMRLALKDLNLKYDPKKVILVSGTNGKGSVSSLLAHFLSGENKKVGLYTSPHLVDTRERIKLNQTFISKSDFVSIYQELNKRTDVHQLSHFETLTLMAILFFFERHQVDYGVFEVGLGGIWDATNILENETAVITSISKDHQNLLGNSLKEILSNKLGIVKNSKIIFHLPFPDETLDLVKQFKNNSSAKFIETKKLIFDKENKKIKTKWGDISSPLWGRRGAENLNLAIETFIGLGGQFFTAKNLTNSYRWPCRLEKVKIKQSDRFVYFSADHNEAGMRSILPWMNESPLHILLGIGEKKDADSMSAIISEVREKKITLTQTPFQTKLISDYPKMLREIATEEIANPKLALERVISKTPPEQRILVTGSIYLVGELLKQSEHWLLEELKIF